MIDDLGLKFNSAKASFLRGIELLEKESYKLAREQFEISLSILPDRASTLVNLSIVEYKLGKLEKSKEYAEQAYKLAPQDLATLNQLGNIYNKKNQYLKAYEVLTLCRNLYPNEIEPLGNLANALTGLRRYQDASLCFSEIDKSHGQSPEVYLNRAALFLQLRKYNEAINFIQNAISIKPNWDEIYILRAKVQSELHQQQLALESLDKAILLNPDNAEAHSIRAQIHLDTKHIERALADFEKSLSLNSDQEYILTDYIGAKVQISDWHNLPNFLSILRDKFYNDTARIRPFNALGLFDDPELHLRVSQNVIKTSFPASRKDFISPPSNPHKKLRIAYYSADFRNHPMSHLIVELFEIHDRERFEIIGFSFGPDDKSEFRYRVSKAFDQFIDVKDMSDSEIVELSRKLEIDIAIDLMGHTRFTRLGIFADQVAPIQAAYLGYPGTTGLDQMHYIIADPVIIPKGHEQFFSEKIVRLPHSYMVNDRKRKISERQFSRQELGLPEHGFIFCCFNNPYKVLPETFESWMKIMKAVEGSVLWLYGNDPLLQSIRRS